MNDITGYECDDAKREENWERRGVDMLLAATMFETGGVRFEVEDLREAYAEERYVAAGTAADGKSYAVVYTDRGAVRRIITAWRINERSERKLHARLTRGVDADVRAGGAEGDA